MNAIEKSIIRKKKRIEKLLLSRKLSEKRIAEEARKNLQQKIAAATASSDDLNHDGRVWMFP